MHLSGPCVCRMLLTPLSLKSMGSLTIQYKDESLGWRWGTLPHQNQVDSCFSKRLQKRASIYQSPLTNSRGTTFLSFGRGSDRRSLEAEKYRTIWTGTEHKPFPHCFCLNPQTRMWTWELMCQRHSILEIHIVSEYFLPWEQQKGEETGCSQGDHPKYTGCCQLPLELLAIA